MNQEQHQILGTEVTARRIRRGVISEGWRDETCLHSFISVPNSSHNHSFH